MIHVSAPLHTRPHQLDRSKPLPFFTYITRALVPVLLVFSLSACSMELSSGGDGSTTAGADTLRLAQATSEAGDNETAARLFEKVLVADPVSVPALLGAGNSYARMGQNSRAEAVQSQDGSQESSNLSSRCCYGALSKSQGCEQERERRYPFCSLHDRQLCWRPQPTAPEAAQLLSGGLA